MCFYLHISKTAVDLRNRFKATFANEHMFVPSDFNGFTFPKTPIITNEHPNDIVLYEWGLMPSWASDISFRKNTLNARIETITEKPSFRNVVHNRCLILADGFYEWQWLDTKGKQKQKYNITLQSQELFAFAGLYSFWIDKNTGEIHNTYTILTTQANELMSEIHNSKKRMPVILTLEQETEWLQNKPFSLENPNLIGVKI